MPPTCRQNEQPFPALLILTTPIPGKGCSCHVYDRLESPMISIHNQQGASSCTPKMCNFTSRSVARPRQSMGRVARGAGKLEKVAILPRVRAFDHANPWEGLRVTPTRCHFTTRSRARPRQSMVRVAIPMEASVPAPALERIFKL